jgi:hypothetical protein
MIVTLAAAFPAGFCAQAEQNPKTNKAIIYPTAQDSIEQLHQQGIKKVDDYGSYWVVEATDAQVDTLQKLRGDRVVKANYLNRIELSAIALDTTAGEPSIPSHLQQSESSGKRLRLIQFKGPVQPQWLDKVKAAGDVRVVSYIPNNSYVVWTDASAEKKLRELKGPHGPLQWIGAYHPYYKISQDLRTVSGNEPIKVRVAVVDDSQELLTANGIQSLGSVNTSLARNGQQIIEMDVVPSAISPIAQLPGVLWIEKVAPKRLLDEVQDLVLASQTNGPGHGPSTSVGITNYLDFLINTVGGGLGSFFDPFTYPVVDVADTGLDKGDPFGLPFHPAFHFFGDPNSFSRVVYFKPPWLSSDPLMQLGCTTRIVPGDRGAFRFLEAADLDGHGTFVASIVAGFDAGTNILNVPALELLPPMSNTVPVTINCSDITNNSATIPVSNGFTNVCQVGQSTTNITFTGLSINACPVMTNAVILFTGITITTSSEVRVDANGFQFGMGVSPFGRIGVTRVWGTMESSVFSIETFNNVCETVFHATGLCVNDLPAIITSAYGSSARIENNSWADALEIHGNNGGLYTSDSQTYDIHVRDAVLPPPGGSTPGPSPLNQEFAVVFACNSLLMDAGNADNPGGFADMRVTAPATAKNVISVGSSVNPRNFGENSLDMALFSAAGFTVDGRFKPEIVAPGQSVFGANNELQPSLEHRDTGLTMTNCSTDKLIATAPDIITSIAPSCTSTTILYRNLYAQRSGSSYAAPAVSGGIQLLWWYFQNRLLNEQDPPQHLLQPSPAMAKAYLCNSARYLPIPDPLTGARDTLPSILQGMGEMDLLRMFDGVARVIRDESSPRAIDAPLITTNPAPQQTYFSQSGQSYEVSGQVASNGLPFRVTVAWTDAPGSPNAFQQLVNDLNLQVTIGGQTYKGNVFSEDHSVIGNNLFDSINNMESVFLPAGGAVTSGAPYRVVVRAENIAGDGVPNVGSDLDQDFALVVYNSQNPSDVPNLATNNACSTAIGITSFPYVFSNNLNTTTYHNVHPSPSVATAAGGADEFFKIEVPTAGATVTVDTFGSSFNTVLSVWRVEVVPQTVFVRGECGALVELVSNSGGQQSKVTFTTDGSNTYYIVVEPRNNGSGGTMVLNVQANAVVTLNPTNLVFGSQFVGTTSVVQTITFQNNTPTAVDISDVTVGGASPLDFIVSGQCPASTVPAGSNCTITVAFSPTATGLRTGTLIVNDDALGGPHTASLSGTGLTPVPAVCSSASSLSFGSVTIGFTSAAKSVTIINCGSAPLVISNSATITGADASDFAIVSDLCSGNSITPGSSCAVGVTFTPLINGSKTASLTFSDNAAGSPHNVPLLGTGASPAPQVCLSTVSIDFGTVLLGDPSPVQSVTVTNCGTAPLMISAVGLTGAAASQFSIVSTTCRNAVLGIGETCTVDVRFTPSLIGAASAAISITNDASGSPHQVTLIGNGTGNQPDALISNRRAAKTFLGDNVYNNTGERQQLSANARRGRRRVFYVRIQNDGNATDTFHVQGTGDTVQGTSVRYFLGAMRREALDITDAVKAGTYTTASMAGGATTGDATLIRVEITADKLAFSGFYETAVTVTSTTNPARSDTVKATVVVK